LSGVKSEVIDQSALEGTVKGAVTRAVEISLQGGAKSVGAKKDEIVSNEPKNRGGRVPRALEVGKAKAPDPSLDGAHDGFMDDAIDSDFSEAELREFLSADYLETRADPAFKESLRKKLWALVSNRYGRGPSSAE